REVLMVYQEIDLQNRSAAAGTEGLKIITVSVDEKPGVQAIANTTPDLPTVPDRHATIARDYEYKRLGTCSIMAALDLHTGHVTARVERRHRSREFVALLQDLDQYYPQDCTIRVILDNHSAHISKETMAFLPTRPNRFKYVHTPTHGSWLNIVETLFGKWPALSSATFVFNPVTNCANAFCWESQKSTKRRSSTDGRSSKR